MIVIIKTRNKNQLLIKALAVLSLFVMFWLYYGHMSEKFQEQKKELTSELHQNITKTKENKSLNVEKTIYKEAVIIVDLLRQKNVQSIKVVKDKLYIVCDYQTDIEPLLIRYGVGAMIKNSKNNIKIAIDLKTIVENKYDV